MENKTQLTNLKKLYRLQKKLEKKGGPEKDGNLFEEILTLEDKVLDAFDLTPSIDNSGLLEGLKDFDDINQGVHFILNMLKIIQSEEGKENYSSLEILAKGIALSESPYDVLSKMKLTHHYYHLFLYQLLIDGKASIIDIFNAMMRSEKYLEEISLLRNSYQNLKSQNIDFFEAYLQSDENDYRD